jgi:EmrB/QacA subfamily drug resistance transporter
MDTKNKAIALLILSLTPFFLSFMIQALNLALPEIGREFGADAILLNWIVLVYVLAVAAFSLPFGRIADIFGIKKIIIIGMVIYTISSVIALLSFSAEMLIACRLVQGISAAMIIVNNMALVTAIFPAEERGRAFGINVTGVYAGSSVGPFLGGILTQYFGWRSIFLVNIPISIILVLLILWKIKGEWSECKGQKFDYIGSVIYVLALVTLMYGFSLLPGITGAILISLGIIGILIFLRWESRTKSPMFNIQIFRNNRTFIFSNLAALINYAAVFAVAFILSLYLQYIKGLAPDEAGLIMIAHPVVQAILSPLAGRFSDKMEPRLVASIGMALTAVALFSFVFLSDNTFVWQIIIALVILGIGFAFFLPPNTNALMSSVAPRYYGVASATMSTMISVGQMLSMGITMVVMAVIIGRVAVTPEYFPAFLASTRIAFGIFTLLCAGGVFISLFRGKVRY